MARRHRVPIVGVGATNQVRLSPRLQALLAHRAQAAARARFAPEIAALRGQRRQIKRTYRQSVRGTQAAVNIAEAQLAKVQKSLKGSGLKGMYLKQTAQAIATRRTGLAQSIPFLTQDARAQKQSDLAGLQTDIIDAKVGQQQAAADKLYSLQSKAYTSGASSLSSRGASRGDRRLASKTALHVASNLFTQIKHKPSSPGEWAFFEDQVAKSEGVTPLQAQAAVDRLRRRLRKAAAPSRPSSGIRAGWGWGLP